MVDDKKKWLTIVIVILAALFVFSAAALTGTLIHNHFLKKEPATVEVPGNIITPDNQEPTDPGAESPSAAPETNASEPETQASAPEATETVPESLLKAGAISLRARHPEENKPFQAVNMFPGDSETQYYRIRVYYHDDIVIRFRASIRPGCGKLAQVLKIRIRLPGADETLYDGLMQDMPKSLKYGLYADESTRSDVYYEITAYLDTSVGNEYMDQNLVADFRWWVEETDHLEAPKTGDTMNIYLWAGVGAGSLILIIIFLGRCRKKADDAKQ